MNININYEDPSFQHDEYEKVIDRVCEEAALVYDLGPKAEISILLCHNDYIHTLNKQYRNIDRPTDVLSFALNDILGYAHMEPDDKAEMRKEEEFILQRLGYVREGEEL